MESPWLLFVGLTFVMPVRADGQCMAQYKCFQMGWADFIAEVFLAYFCRICMIDLPGVFFPRFHFRLQLTGNHVAEVVHGKPCKDLLHHKVHLF